MQSQAALFPYLSEDISTEMFTDLFDSTMRLHAGRTCRAAHAFFNSNIHHALVVDLRKMLAAIGFRCSAPDFNLSVIPAKHIALFLSLLKYPYINSRDKLAFVDMIRSWNLTNTNLSTWRVAIFCFFLMHDIQTNTPAIDHGFITAKNLFLFKGLLQSPYKQCRIRPTESFLYCVLQQPDVTAQPLVGEILKSNIYRPFEEYPTLLRFIDLGLLPATTTQLTVEQEINATFKMAGTFPYTLLENLNVLYQANRRTAKWASGVIRSTTEKDRELLSNHFCHRHHLDEADLLVSGFIALQHFPAILPKYFAPFKNDTAGAVVRAKKILLSFLIQTRDATEARRRCLTFTTPSFLTEVAKALVAKQDSLIDSCIMLEPILNPPSDNCSPQRFLV